MVSLRAKIEAVEKEAATKRDERSKETVLSESTKRAVKLHSGNVCTYTPFIYHSINW